MKAFETPLASPKMRFEEEDANATVEPFSLSGGVTAIDPFGSPPSSLRTARSNVFSPRWMRYRSLAVGEGRKEPTGCGSGNTKLSRGVVNAIVEPSCDKASDSTDGDAPGLPVLAARVSSRVPCLRVTPGFILVRKTSRPPGLVMLGRSAAPARNATV